MEHTLAAFADEADGMIDGQIAALVENGISLLEIRGVNGRNIADIGAAEAKELWLRLDDAGISVWSVGSPFGKIGIGDDFEPHLEQFRRCLDTAGIIGAHTLRLFSFYVPAGKAEDCRGQVLERLAAFAGAARGYVITLCHENEKGIFGDVAARCAEIHRELPELKAVFDPANFVQCGQDTEEAWNVLAPYVWYMHVKDALPDGRVVPAGAGAGRLPSLLRQYKGSVLTVEPHLAVFAGLEKLEGGRKPALAPYCYPSQRAAFDAAVEALRALLKDA